MHEDHATFILNDDMNQVDIVEGDECMYTHLNIYTRFSHEYFISDKVIGIKAKKFFLFFSSET